MYSFFFLFFLFVFFFPSFLESVSKKIIVRKKYARFFWRDTKHPNTDIKTRRCALSKKKKTTTTTTLGFSSSSVSSLQASSDDDETLE